MAQHRFDALILTALTDELEPVLAFGKDGKAGWTQVENPGQPRYYFRDLLQADGVTSLRIAAASFNEMGAVEAAYRVGRFIEFLKPACLAMCGICAGNKKEVALGDVIIADRVYHYEYGKLVAWRDEAGQRVEELYHDLKTYNLEDSWRVHAEEFTHPLDWTVMLSAQRPLSLEVQQHWLLRTLLEYEQEGQEPPYDFGGPERERYCPDFAKLFDRLRQPQSGLLEAGGKPRLTEKGRAHAIEWMFKHPKALPRDRDFRVHIGTIATGSVVQKDPELFSRLERLIRKTLGAEMEAMAIGLAGEHGQIKSLVVKAVSDYGDGDKDDRFRKFAARASAEVLLRFLLQELEPAVQEPAASPERHSLDGLSAVHGGSPHHDDLLSRVQRITELRVESLKQTADIHRFPGRPPVGDYLRVATVEGPFRSVFPVAAVEQVTPEVLEAFLADIDAIYRRQDVGVRSTLVYGGDPPPAELAARAAAKGVLLQSFTEHQGLIDFRSYLDHQLRRLEQDPRYPPALYVPSTLSSRPT